MFGIGMASAYGQYTVDLLGGINAAFLYAVFVRILVGIGWYFQFKRAGKNPLYAFVPIVGSYTAFRMVWDDFSFSFIFAATTVIAFIAGILTEQSSSIVDACAILNFIMWWFYALLSTRAFGVTLFLGFLYGGIPWLGALLLGFWPSAEYKGAWSSDPNDERNLSAQERKKRRKREAKQAKAEQERLRQARKKARSDAAKQE